MENRLNITDEAKTIVKDKIYSFSKNMLQNMNEIPPEFEEYFQENFWELLA